MNEKNKLFIILGVFAASFIGILLMSANEQKTSNNIYNEFTTSLNSESLEVIYIGRPTCSYCALLEPSLEDMSQRYDFEYTYVNTDELNESDIQKLATDLKITSMPTPYLAIVKNGEIIDIQNGYQDYDLTFEFFKENEVIAEDEVLAIDYINYDEYENIVDSKEKSIVVIGQSTCIYCIQAKVLFNEILDEYDVDINYLNLNYLEEEEYELFQASFEEFEEGVGTPYLAIIEDKEIIETMEGFASKQDYIDLFEKEGLINE